MRTQKEDDNIPVVKGYGDGGLGHPGLAVLTKGFDINSVQYPFTIIILCNFGYLAYIVIYVNSC